MTLGWVNLFFRSWVKIFFRLTALEHLKPCVLPTEAVGTGLWDKGNILLVWYMLDIGYPKEQYRIVKDVLSVMHSMKSLQQHAFLIHCQRLGQ